MSTTKKTLEFDCFHNEVGEPVCAIDFSKSDGICQFLWSKTFGTKFTCMFTGKNVNRDKTGFLKPCTDCPMHK